MARDNAAAPNWRLATDYDDLRDMDRPGFAWELLRRNQGYRRDAAELALPSDDSALTVTPAAARIAAKWGLGFPGISVPRCAVRAAVLAR